MKTKLQTIFKKSAYWTGVILFGTILGISLQFAKAWTEPTATAPGGNVGAPITTGGAQQAKKGPLIIGDAVNDDYVPSSSDWDYTLRLDSKDTTSIGFHDSMHSVGSIKYKGGEFRIGENIGYGVANTVFGGNITSPGIEARWAGGTPYVDFSNDASTDYDGRIILDYDDVLTVQGATIGSTYQGGDPTPYGQASLMKWGMNSSKDIFIEPAAGSNLYLTDGWNGTGTLHIEFGKTTFKGGDISYDIEHIVNGSVLTFEENLGKKVYTTTGFNVIPNEDILNYCGDSDGCLLTMNTEHDARKESVDARLFYSLGQNLWEFSTDDDIGNKVFYNQNGSAERWCKWSRCCLTDVESGANWSGGTNCGAPSSGSCLTGNDSDGHFGVISRPGLAQNCSVILRD